MILPSNTAVNFPGGKNGVAGLQSSTKSQRFGRTITSETFPSAEVNFTAKPLVSAAEVEMVASVAMQTKTTPRRKDARARRAIANKSSAPLRLCVFALKFIPDDKFSRPWTEGKI